MTTDLLKRLESGETGREMDLAIGTLWPDPSFSLSIEQKRGGLPPVPEFTASLDAAVALVERVRPDITAWEIRSRHAKRLFFAELSKLEGDHYQVVWDAYSPTPAAALIAALLKAKGAGDE